MSHLRIAGVLVNFALAMALGACSLVDHRVETEAPDVDHDGARYEGRVEAPDEEPPIDLASLTDVPVRLALRGEQWPQQVEGTAVSISDTVLVLELPHRTQRITVPIGQVERLQYEHRTHPFEGIGERAGAYLGLALGVGLSMANPEEFSPIVEPILMAAAGISIGGFFGRLTRSSYEWKDVPLGGSAPHEAATVERAAERDLSFGLTFSF